MSKISKKQRLDKCISHAFSLSRNASFALIKQGRVLVDNVVITDPTFKVSTESNLSLDDFDVSFDDAFKKRVFMLNKPRDFICADRDKNHRIVIDLFSENKKEDLHCAGRLDIDTTGLLIVTDDGNLIHEITSPKKDILKTYIAVVDKDIPESAILKFKNGIKHPDEKKRYKSATLNILSNRCAEVIVSEGRFHEVKRLFEVININVLELTRTKIGSLELDENLEEGEYRELSLEEIDLIFS